MESSEMLKQKNCDSRDINTISHLYCNQIAKVRVNQNTLEVEIQRGFHQLCVFLNVYSKQIFMEALSHSIEGIFINREILNVL